MLGIMKIGKAGDVRKHAAKETSESRNGNMKDLSALHTASSTDGCSKPKYHK